MNNWIYPQLIDDLKTNCKVFLNGNMDVSTIQSIIYQTEIQIVALEEKWLRTILSNIENEIEFAQFTIDSNELYQYVCKKIENLLFILNKFERESYNG